MDLISFIPDKILSTNTQLGQPDRKMNQKLQKEILTSNQMSEIPQGNHSFCIYYFLFYYSFVVIDWSTQDVSWYLLLTLSPLHSNITNMFQLLLSALNSIAKRWSLTDRKERWSAEVRVYLIPEEKRCQRICLGLQIGWYVNILKVKWKEEQCLFKSCKLYDL